MQATSKDNKADTSDSASAFPSKVLRLLRPSFADKDLEEKFLRTYRDEAVPMLRALTLVAMALALIFLWEDNELSPTGYRATNIRIYGIAPLCLLTWYVLGLPYSQRHSETIASLFVLSYTCLVIAIALVFEPGQYGLSGPVGAGNFILITIATFTYLRVPRALFVAAGVLAIYWTSALIWTEFDSHRFFSECFGIVVLAFILGTVTGTMFEDLRRRQFFASWQLEKERERYKALLYTLVPAAIACRVEKGEFPIADSQAEVAILFSDLVGFTALTQQVSPRILVQLLNELFFEFDNAAEQRGVEKIKTIGDGYMAACGLPVLEGRRTISVANLALDMITISKRIAEKYGVVLGIRVGIHTGNLIAGVIGKSRYTYDMWGESVNMASRMESTGVTNRIQITETSYKRLKDHFPCEPRGEIPIKGMGSINTFLILESASPASPSLV